MQRLLNIILHVIGYRHSKWQFYNGAKAWRWKDGAWEVRDMTDEELEDVNDRLTFQF